MSKWHYEWWTVKVQETTGVWTWEVKARSKKHAIGQIKKRVRDQNADTHQGDVVEVFWDTLELNRIGYWRLG